MGGYLFICRIRGDEICVRHCLRGESKTHIAGVHSTGSRARHNKLKIFRFMPDIFKRPLIVIGEHCFSEYPEFHDFLFRSLYIFQICLDLFSKI